MNMTEIDNTLRQLRLSGMQQTLSTRAMQAQASQEPFLETFAALLQDELDRRKSTLMDRRYKRSGLDEKASLADLDWRFNPRIPREVHHRRGQCVDCGQTGHGQEPCGQGAGLPGDAARL